MSIKEVKEFLNRSYKIERRINSKIEQITVLRSLTCKITSTFSDMPPNSTKNMQTMEQIISKILDLETEIFGDLQALIIIKEEVTKFIKQIENKEFKLILELRYLCSKNWYEIAKELNYSSENIFKLHYKALKIVDSKKLYSKLH